ncbi:glutamate--cysteine ligase [Shewanella sp. Scap07]|uniref:glutamate--cysteine ligase n=1 Tax=Shewanella sp. Scap07 TaxID=2589987 RepID=UPI0015BC977E|nr:glutamate--cysteine ligase [Shewanella sp. Scap07]QLE84781.1 glutamate--cysteine ligase [Shewanella sp. Scap07]
MKSFNEVIEQLSDTDSQRALGDLHRGIEREALRIDAAGHLSMQPHPKALGSALTHSRITTDYSESLLEFITPVHGDIESLFTDLTYTHAYTVQNLNGEQLWPVSMPCYVGNIEDIPIADYGSSNSGQMKRLYRKGLTYRYGAQMQIISGVHFNFSVSKSLWQRLYEVQGAEGGRCNFISESYFGLIRNYRRLVWVLPYLFGASPALCGSFIKDQQTDIPFEKMGKGTLYLPYATSLRMSDLGYTNKEQERLSISYNSLDEYLKGVDAAINMSSDKFAEIGVKVDGEFRQLNANVLQIENEFYSPIRAKRVSLPGEKPSEALARAGVEYIEVRALDVNPFSSVGITASQVRFLDMFILYCLLQPSPPSDASEEQALSDNLNQVILQGRDPQLQLNRDGEMVSKTAWLHDIFADLQKIAKQLDGEQGEAYQQALAHWHQAVDNPDLTLSGQLMQQLFDQQLDHGEWVMRLAKQYHQELQQLPLPSDVQASYKQAAEESLVQQTEIEQSDAVTFEQFLDDYFKPQVDDAKVG